MHLQTNGFIVHVASKASNVLEVQFTGYHASSETFFYGEFVILVARRYFQSTFKCDVRLLLLRKERKFSCIDVLLL